MYRDRGQNLLHFFAIAMIFACMGADFFPDHKIGADPDTESTPRASGYCSDHAWVAIAFAFLQN